MPRWLRPALSLLLLLAVLGQVSRAQAQPVFIDSVGVDPDPVEAGQTVSIDIQVFGSLPFGSDVYLTVGHPALTTLQNQDCNLSGGDPECSFPLFSGFGSYTVDLEVDAAFQNETFDVELAVSEFPGAGLVEPITTVPIGVIPLRAELSVTGVNPQDDPVAPGATSRVDYSLFNSGNGDAMGFRVGAYLSNDGDFDAGDTLLGTESWDALQADVSGFGSIEFTVPAAPLGDYSVFIVVDDEGVVDEALEDNNANSEPVTVGGPDVAPSALSVSTSFVLAGETFDVGYSRDNLGNTEAFSGEDGVYLSFDAVVSGDDLPLGTVSWSDLNGGQSQLVDLSLTLPDPLVAGPINLLVVTDELGDVDELDETNNVGVLVGVIEVLGTPDATTEMSLAETPLVIGDSTTGTIVPRSFGGQVETRADVFTMTTDGGTLSGLSPSVGDEFTFTYTAPATTGSYTISNGIGDDVTVIVTVPQISGIDPQSAPTRGTTTLTITGSLFGSAPGTVTIGGAPCPVVSWADDLITCAIPDGQGAGLDVVVTHALNVPGSLTEAFSYEPPAITGVSANGNSTAGGDTLTITGVNFTGTVAPTVAVGTESCAVTGYSFSQITCSTPAGEGIQPVRVTLAGQSSNTDVFVYGAPQLDSLSTTVGDAAGGTLLTLTGQNFGLGNGSVSVGEALCSPQGWSHTQIDCLTPAGTGVVDVFVSVGGQSSDALSFTYLDTPDASSTLSLDDTTLQLGETTSGTFVPRVGGSPVYAAASSLALSADGGTFSALTPAIGTAFDFTFTAPLAAGTYTITEATSGLEVVVTVDLDPAGLAVDVAAPASALIGETITYTVTLDNTNIPSDLVLTGLTDDVLGDLTAEAEAAGCLTLGDSREPDVPIIVNIDMEAGDPGDRTYEGPGVLGTGTVWNSVDYINYNLLDEHGNPLSELTVPFSQGPVTTIYEGRLHDSGVTASILLTGLPLVVETMVVYAVPNEFGDPFVHDGAGWNDCNAAPGPAEHFTCPLEDVATFDSGGQPTAQIFMGAGVMTGLQLIGAYDPPRPTSCSFDLDYTVTAGAADPLVNTMTATYTSDFGTIEQTAGATVDIAPTPLTGLVINEFVANHVSADTYEYVEILGAPDQDLVAVTILEIEGDGSGAGTIDGVFTLEATDGAGYAVLGPLSNEIENGTVTFLLVGGFTGGVGDDLDADNDGVLDNPPWTGFYDGVAMTDRDAGDATYAEVALTADFDGLGGVLGGASRIPDGVDTDTDADWVRNDFGGEGLPGFSGDPVLGEALNTPGTANALVIEPAISAIDPLTGPTNGGFALTLTGAGFYSGTGTVTIGGVPCPIVSWTPNAVICTVQAGQGAGLTVELETSGDLPATSPTDFSYARPVISELSASGDRTEGGDTLTIDGSNLFGIGAPTVSVGGEPCNVDEPAATFSQVSCALPPGEGLDNEVVVSLGLQPSQNNPSFAYGAPIVDAISPSAGDSSGGTEVVVTGDNFGLGTGSVTIDSLPCTPVAGGWSHTSITCVTPPGSGQDLPVQASVAGQISNSNVVFSYLPLPDDATMNLAETVLLPGETVLGTIEAFSGGTLVTTAASAFTLTAQGDAFSPGVPTFSALTPPFGDTFTFTFTAPPVPDCGDVFTRCTDAGEPFYACEDVTAACNAGRWVGEYTIDNGIGDPVVVNVVQAAPYADLEDPVAGGFADAGSLSTIDVRFRAADLDPQSVLDAAPELDLTVNGQPAPNLGIVVGNFPVALGDGVYQYSVTGSFPLGRVEVEFLPGSFASADGTQNVGETQAFFVGTAGDADGDGVAAGPGTEDDCDDLDPYTYPGAPDHYDGKRNDCTGGGPDPDFPGRRVPVTAGPYNVNGACTATACSLFDALAATDAVEGPDVIALTNDTDLTLEPLEIGLEPLGEAFYDVTLDASGTATIAGAFAVAEVAGAVTGIGPGLTLYGEDADLVFGPAGVAAPHLASSRIDVSAVILEAGAYALNGFPIANLSPPSLVPIDLVGGGDIDLVETTFSTELFNYSLAINTTGSAVNVDVPYDLDITFADGGDVARLTFEVGPQLDWLSLAGNDGVFGIFEATTTASGRLRIECPAQNGCGAGIYPDGYDGTSGTGFPLLFFGELASQGVGIGDFALEIDPDGHYGYNLTPVDTAETGSLFEVEGFALYGSSGPFTLEAGGGVAERIFDEATRRLGGAELRVAPNRPLEGLYQGDFDFDVGPIAAQFEAHASGGGLATYGRYLVEDADLSWVFDPGATDIEELGTFTASGDPAVCPPVHNVRDTIGDALARIAQPCLLSPAALNALGYIDVVATDALDVTSILDGGPEIELRIDDLPAPGVVVDGAPMAVGGGVYRYAFTGALPELARVEVSFLAGAMNNQFDGEANLAQDQLLGPGDLDMSGFGTLAVTTLGDGFIDDPSKYQLTLGPASLGPAQLVGPGSPPINVTDLGIEPTAPDFFSNPFFVVGGSATDVDSFLGEPGGPELQFTGSLNLNLLPDGAYQMTAGGPAELVGAGGPTLTGDLSILRDSARTPPFNENDLTNAVLDVPGLASATGSFIVDAAFNADRGAHDLIVSGSGADIVSGSPTAYLAISDADLSSVFGIGGVYAAQSVGGVATLIGVDGALLSGDFGLDVNQGAIAGPDRSRVLGTGVTLGVLGEVFTGDFGFAVADAGPTGPSGLTVSGALDPYCLVAGPPAQGCFSNGLLVGLLLDSGVHLSATGDVDLGVSGTALTGSLGLDLNSEQTPFQGTFTFPSLGQDITFDQPAGPFVHLSGQNLGLDVGGETLVGDLVLTKATDGLGTSLIRVDGSNVASCLGDTTDDIVCLDGGTLLGAVTADGLASLADGSFAINNPNVGLQASPSLRINTAATAVSQTFVVGPTILTLEVPAGPLFDVHAPQAVLDVPGGSLSGDFNFASVADGPGDTLLLVSGANVSTGFGDSGPSGQAVVLANGGLTARLTASDIYGVGSGDFALNVPGTDLSGDALLRLNTANTDISDQLPTSPTPTIVELPAGPLFDVEVQGATLSVLGHSVSGDVMIFNTTSPSGETTAALSGVEAATCLDDGAGASACLSEGTLSGRLSTAGLAAVASGTVAITAGDVAIGGGLELQINNGPAVNETIGGQALDLPAGPFFHLAGQGVTLETLGKVFVGDFRIIEVANPILIGLSDLVLAGSNLGGFCLGDGTTDLACASNASLTGVLLADGLAADGTTDVAVTAPDVIAFTGGFELRINGTGQSISKSLVVDNVTTTLSLPAGPFVGLGAENATFEVLGTSIAGGFALNELNGQGILVQGVDASVSLGDGSNELASFGAASLTALLTATGAGGDLTGTFSLNVPGVALGGSPNLRFNTRDTPLSELVSVGPTSIELDLPAGPFVAVSVESSALSVAGIDLAGNFRLQEVAGFGLALTGTDVSAGLGGSTPALLTASDGNLSGLLRSDGGYGTASVTSTLNVPGVTLSGAPELQFNTVAATINDSFTLEGSVLNFDLPAGPFVGVAVTSGALGAGVDLAGDFRIVDAPGLGLDVTGTDLVTQLGAGPQVSFSNGQCRALFAVNGGAGLVGGDGAIQAPGVTASGLDTIAFNTGSAAVDVTLPGTEPVTLELGAGPFAELFGQDAAIDIDGRFQIAGGVAFTEDGDDVIGAGSGTATLGNPVGPGLRIASAPFGLILRPNGEIGVQSTGSTVLLGLESDLTITGNAVLTSSTVSTAIDRTLLVGPYSAPITLPDIDLEGATISGGQLDITGLGSLSGEFNVEAETLNDGPTTTTELRIFGEDTTFTTGESGAALAITDAAFGALLLESGYALRSQGGTTGLSGVTGLEMTGDLSVGANTLGNSTIGVSVGSVDLGFAGDEFGLGGNATLTTPELPPLSGNLLFQRRSAGGLEAIGTVSASVGQPGGTIETSGADLSLIVAPDGSFALGATGSLDLLGVPAVALSGTATAGLNTTGVAVDELIDIGGQTSTLQLAADANGFGGLASLTIDDGPSFAGDFLFGETSGNAIAAAQNVAAFYGAGEGADQTGVGFGGGALALLVEPGAYAMQASGELEVVGVDDLAGSGPLAIAINTTGHAVLETIAIDTPGGPVGGTITFADGADVSRVRAIGADLQLAENIVVSADLHFEKTETGFGPDDNGDGQPDGLELALRVGGYMSNGLIGSSDPNVGVALDNGRIGIQVERTFDTTAPGTATPAQWASLLDAVMVAIGTPDAFWASPAQLTINPGLDLAGPGVTLPDDSLFDLSPVDGLTGRRLNVADPVATDALDEWFAFVSALADTDAPVIEVVRELQSGLFVVPAGLSLDVARGYRLRAEGQGGADLSALSGGPTLDIVGGEVVLRGLNIFESDDSAQTAIAIGESASVDLGTVDEPGGNSFIASGDGLFIDHGGDIFASAIGNSFEVDGLQIIDPWEIEEGIIHLFDDSARGLVLVSATDVHLFISAPTVDLDLRDLFADQDGTNPVFSILDQSNVVPTLQADGFTLDVVLDETAGEPFSVTLEATFDDAPAVTRTANLRLRNRAPTDIAIDSNIVAENQPTGTLVGTLSAVDPDLSESFAFALTDTLGANDNLFFEVVDDALQTAVVFDFEAESAFTVEVTVTDSGGLSTTKLIPVSVTDLDECNVDNGGCEQSCADDTGIVVCSCDAGYTLNPDGISCDDLDECATGNGGCEQICLNDVGTFTCACNAGFTLNADGFSCDDINDPSDETVVVEASAGQTVSTDPEGDGATPDDPVETSVTTPNAGTVSIRESSFTSTLPPGFTPVGPEITLSAPPATPDDPLVIVFTIDGSLVAEGEDGSDFFIFKDGAMVADCADLTSTVADPDPCLSMRALSGDDIVLTVYTSTASVWTIAVRSEPVPDRIAYLLERSFAGEDLLAFDGNSDMDVNDFVIDIGGCALLAESGGEASTAVTELIYVYNVRHVGAGSVDNRFFHTVPAPFPEAGQELPVVTCTDTFRGSSALDPGSARSVAATPDRGYVQVPVYDSTRDPFDGLGGFIYTDPSVDISPDGNRVTECRIRFANPVPMALTDLLGDPFLNRDGTGVRAGGAPGTAVEVHAASHTLVPFLTDDADARSAEPLANGAPPGLIIPRPGWLPPTERTDVVLAYETLVTDSGGPWYDVFEPSLVFMTDAGGDEPPPYRFPTGSLCATGGCDADSQCPDGEACFFGFCRPPEVVVDERE